jgi:protein CpxP
MIKFITKNVSKIATVLLVGGLSLAHPAYADVSSPEVKSAAVLKKSHTKNSQSRVESRIQSLHDKLNITDDQEDQWKLVANVMRENEMTIHALTEARHADDDATAIDDLKSYKKIAAAHVEGLENLISAFSTLYDGMSDEQKSNADSLFSKFEGHPGRASKVAQ